MDEAFEFYIEERHIPWPSSKKRDLCNRIDVLAGSGNLIDKGQCHRIRERRNELAHDARIFVTWNELTTCLDSIETELKNLGLVGERPKYAWFATVTPFRNPSGQALVTYSYGLKAPDDVTVMEVTWTEADTVLE